MVDKLLAKDVGKGRLTGLQAKETRERISVVDSLEGMRDVDMVVEVRVLCFYVFSISADGNWCHLIKWVINCRLYQNLCH